MMICYPRAQQQPAISIIVLMINRKKLRNSLQTPPSSKSGFLKWIQTEVIQTNCDLSDQYCRFLIHDTYQIRGNNIIIQLYCKPTQGIFAQFEFRPNIYINSTNLVERPKIYNDRRVFHPNINVFTCQIVSKELVVNWNPTKEFSALLRHLKYLIIQPNCNFVPNNDYNRKAAWTFHFNSLNYRAFLDKYTPSYLEQQISGELDNHLNHLMEIEGQQSDHFSQNDFWGVNRSIHKSKNMTVMQSFQQNTEEENIELLAKKIKSIHVSIEETVPQIQQSQCVE